MRITEADLIYNGLPEPIDSIRFESTGMTKEELEAEIDRQFRPKIKFSYFDQNIYNKKKNDAKRTKKI